MKFYHISLLLTLLVSKVFGQHDEEPVTHHLPHNGCKFLQKHRIAPLEKQVGRKYEERSRNSSYRVSNEAGETAAACNNGYAAGYPCNSVDLLSMIDNAGLSNNLPGSNNAVNDIWGWTHSNREFALVGTVEGVAFVEITNPNNPVHLGGLSSATEASIWRDIKTIGDYAVIGSEANDHGLQIFDLTELLSVSSPTEFSTTIRFTGFGNSHNLFVHEDKGFVYAVGTNRCRGGLYIVDMNDPLNPSKAGCYSDDGYTHDVQCVTYDGPDMQYVGREICFASNENTVSIVDVTNKGNIVLLSKTTYSGQGYTHQGWLTDDHAHFIFNDELDELYGFASKTSTHVMNVSDLNNPTYRGKHDGRTAAIDHNLYVQGDYVYQANYRAGFNVLKIQSVNSATFEEAGYFDIFPESDSNRFNGAWSTYPFFPSGNIIVSGVEQGLFVLKFNDGGGSPPTPNPPTPNPPTPNPPTYYNDDNSGDNVDDGDDNGYDDDFDCEDEEIFLEKYKKSKNKLITRECSWLNERPKKIGKFCDKKWRYQEKDGIVYKPPHDACGSTCHACTACHEMPKFKFFLKTKNGASVVKNCKWLEKKNPSKKKSICSSNDTDGVYPGASAICPITCKIDTCA